MRETVVRPGDKKSDAFDVERFTQSHGQIKELKSNLPPDAVEGLAREVLQRLSEHQHDVSAVSPTTSEISEFCESLLSEDDLAASMLIHDARAAGASIETVYLQYLSRAARMLGAWWDDDRISFIQVTLGTSRMYAIMRAVRAEASSPRLTSNRSAVFVSVPGETHTLGVRMATDLFRLDGWNIDFLVDKSHEELVSEIGTLRPNIVGISAGGEHALDALSKLIIALRIKVKSAYLLVGGHIVEEAEDLVALLGADGVAPDVHTAKDLLWSQYNQA